MAETVPPPPATASLAKKRWKILSGAIVKASKAKKKKMEETANGENPIRYPNYGLLRVEKTEPRDQEPDRVWYRVSIARDGDTKDSLEICVLRPDFSVHDLMGFNNTGNVCVWPAEECLAAYCLENSEVFRGAKVVELGGGMTSLAGLLLAQRVPDVTSVVLTDGNEASVDNLGAILDRSGRSKVSASVLRWGSDVPPSMAGAFDFVICADCLFFDEFRTALRDCLAALLKPGVGRAIVVAPRRGHTLASFVSLCSETFSTVRQRERYSDAIWRRREELLSEPDFDEDLHYPVLLELAGPKPKSSL